MITWTKSNNLTSYLYRSWVIIRGEIPSQARKPRIAGFGVVTLTNKQTSISYTKSRCRHLHIDIYVIITHCYSVWLAFGILKFETNSTRLACDSSLGPHGTSRLELPPGSTRAHFAGLLNHGDDCPCTLSNSLFHRSYCIQGIKFFYSSNSINKVLSSRSSAITSLTIITLHSSFPHTTKPANPSSQTKNALLHSAPRSSSACGHRLSRWYPGLAGLRLW